MALLFRQFREEQLVIEVQQWWGGASEPLAFAETHELSDPHLYSCIDEEFATMSTKRKREGDEKPVERNKSVKKGKSSFDVGHRNLPDSLHRRKTQQIKSDLIERAKIKKEYAKVKGKAEDEPERLPQPASMAVEEADHEPTNTPHPARQELIEKEEASPEVRPEDRPRPERRKRQPKVAPFKKESDQAQRRKSEAEERRKAREEAERQRTEKIEERERFRRAMAKARTGGPNGQRKLGRESKVLLERVKKMVGDGGG